MVIRVKDAEMKAREESLKAEYKALLREAAAAHEAKAIKLVKAKKEDFDKLLEIEKQRLQKEKDMEVEQVRRRYAPREEKRNEMDECLGRRMGGAEGRAPQGHTRVLSSPHKDARA